MKSDNKKLITICNLRSILSYCPISGLFIWKTGRRKNNIAGYKTVRGYIVLNINKKIYYAHRLAWFYITENWPEYEIDHINCNKSDNSFLNLRNISRSHNNCNKFKQSNNTSGYKGISFNKKTNKYEVYITINKKRVYLGLYVDIEKAKIAINEARNNIHKEYGRID